MENLLLIRGGTVLNGEADAVPAPCDLLIEGERIRRMARSLHAPRARALEAEGLVVAPGFIDIHSHSDTTAFLDPSAQGRVFEGVTTEINGMCGLSLFPIAGPLAEQRRNSLRRRGIAADWTDAAGYFHRLEAVGSAVNRAFFVGHGSLRAAVMGFEARAPNAREMRRMEALLEEALEQGVAGLSSGLCYPPGCFAATQELVALCRRTAAFGRPYTTHIRSEGRGLMGAIREAIRISRSSGASLHISHVKTRGRTNWWKIDGLERALFAARGDGVDLTGDRYPYTAALTDLSTIFPESLMAGGKGCALKRLSDPAMRMTLKKWVEGSRVARRRWDEILISTASEETKEFIGLTVAEAAERMGVDPFDAVVELLLRARLEVTAIFFDLSEENLNRILKWPFIFIGSDSSARNIAGPTAEGKPHPRTFGTFARFLREHVLRRRLLRLPEAMARITSLPAARFGLKDRGRLKEGAYADIVAFDPSRIRDRATYAEPFQLSEGMHHVLVNGQPVLERGERTGALPGKVLRAGG